MDMDDTKRLELIVEAVRYCQRVAAMGMPASCYTKALREPIFYLWSSRDGLTKATRAKFRSKAAIGLKYGKREIVSDHAIPFTYQQAELLKLPEVSADTVRHILELEKFNLCAIVTKEEDTRLNRAGLGSAMPAHWDGLDPLA